MWYPPTLRFRGLVILVVVHLLDRLLRPLLRFSPTCVFVQVPSMRHLVALGINAVAVISRVHSVKFLVDRH